MAETAKEEVQRPNILIILADDLGYSDLGCYGGEIRTPNLDSLAKNGLRFTRSYNSSRCCPSRASLLTGLYPHQAGIGRFVGNGKLPGYRGRLTERCVTLAEVLEPSGYATYASGKWHVNDPSPTNRGFREFYGFVHGYAVDSWDPSMMIRLPEGRKAKIYPAGNYFATDAISDHALEFLDTARKTGQPWLLYTAYQAPHFPIQAPPELSATYEKIYQQGWDKLRLKRLKKMKELGIIPANLSLPPRSPIDDLKVAAKKGSLTKDGHNPAWDGLPADRRADLARRMAVYAAMVEGMDANIGRLLASLRKNGKWRTHSSFSSAIMVPVLSGSHLVSILAQLVKRIVNQITVSTVTLPANPTIFTQVANSPPWGARVAYSVTVPHGQISPALPSGSTNTMRMRVASALP